MPVLVHGSSGLDSTLLVTSVSQVILNPDCRTVRGIHPNVYGIANFAKLGFRSSSSSRKGVVAGGLPIPAKTRKELLHEF